MNIIQQLLIELTNNQLWAQQLTILFSTLAVFLIFLSSLMFINAQFDPVRLRLLRSLKTSDKQTDINIEEKEGNAYQRYSKILIPSNNELTSRTKKRLNFAGFHYTSHITQYYAIRLVLILTLPTLVLAFIPFFPNLQANQIIQSMLIAAVLGYILPSFILDRMIKTRQKNIQRAFPDALDLLVVCTEAGLSLDASIQKVAEEIKFSQPILSEELNLVISELRAGIDRKKALIGIADRTGVEDIKGLMSSINQSMKFGSSIAETLRVYSEEFRDKRIQAAEEKAAKIGAKLIFPIAVCLLPSFILLVIVPFALNLMQVFKNF